MVDEQKTEEGTKQTEAVKDSGDRLKSEADKEIERINADTERINKAFAENENAKARSRLGGVTDAGKPEEVKAKITNKEYSQSVIRGKPLTIEEDETNKA